MLNKLWENHRRFMIQCGGGLVVFLFLNSVASSYIDRADSVNAASRTLLNENRLLHKDLESKFWDEKAKVDAYAEFEKLLNRSLCVPLPAPAAVAGGSVSIKFDKVIAEVWEAVLPEANRIGLTLPARLTAQDFGVRPEDGVVEFARYYLYLDVVRQALDVLVKSGVTEIGAPDLLEEDAREIVDGGGAVLVRRGVSFPASTSYEGVLKILSRVQDPEKFLQVNVRNLRSPRGRAPSDSGALRADVAFFALGIEEVPEVAGASGSGPSDSGRGAR